MTEYTVHKANESAASPKVSIILLDWSVREHFQALTWLPQQNIPRKTYELIWIELYDRVVPQAMANADVVITCNQRGQYHKHVGYNVGLLEARGDIVTVCDSDAVFPPDFVESILQAFALTNDSQPIPLVLMHYEWRTRTTYPDNLTNIDQLTNYQWADLWPNVGACMSVRKTDALRFGGFDEHRSLRGYMCGPYDLGWRLVNAGIPEIWHDERVALWHFAHPDPVGSFGQKFSLKLWREIAHPHLDGHALTLVEAFSTGRMLPLQENPEVFHRRMKARKIGTPFETDYAWIAPSQFTKRARWRLRLAHLLLGQPYLKVLARKLGLGRIRHHIAPPASRRNHAKLPQLVQEGYRRHNIVRYDGHFYALSQLMGHVDLTLETERQQPDVIAGETLQSVKERVNEVVLHTPTLLESYQGHNIVSYQKKIYAIPVLLGHTDLRLAEHRQHPQVIVGDHLEQVRERVAAAAPLIPTLLAPYKRHNLVRYQEAFYAIPLSLGHVDLTLETERQRPDVIHAETLHDLKTYLDLHTQHSFWLSLLRGALGNLRRGGLRGLLHYLQATFKLHQQFRTMRNTK